MENRSWLVDSFTYDTYCQGQGVPYRREVTPISLKGILCCHRRPFLAHNFVTSGPRCPWTPGFTAPGLGAPKDPPQMGRKGRSGVIEGRAGQGVHFIAVKSTHRWKGCLQMTPTRTRTRARKMLAGSVKEDTSCGSNDLQTNTLEGLTAKDWKEVLKLKETITKIDVVKKSGNFENNRAWWNQNLQTESSFIGGRVCSSSDTKSKMSSLLCWISVLKECSDYSQVTESYDKEEVKI